MPARCGDELALGPPGPLTLAGSFPARVRATERARFDGTITVVNESGEPVEELTASRPDVYLLHSGRIVALPLPRDELGVHLSLAPGAAHDLPAAGSLTSCDAARPLPPGHYEIHAVLPIVGHEPAAGGPWPLQIR